jgi:hypothetical protein
MRRADKRKAAKGPAALLYPINEHMFDHRKSLDPGEAAMARVKFVQKSGSEQNIEIGENVSVMLATVRSGIRGIDGECSPEVRS